VSAELDATAGAALLLGGAIALRRRPRDRCGALLALAGALWLAGSVAPGITPLLTAHRGPLVHAALAYPDGRLRGRGAQLAAALAWVTGLVPALAGAPAITIGLAVLVAAAGATAALRARGPRRQARRVGAVVAAAMTAVPAAGALLALAAVAAESTVIELYAIVVLGAAATLTAGLGRPRVERLVIELGASPAGATLRQSLGDALGDPGLTVAYRLPGGGFVDAAGRPADLEAERGERVVTTLRHAGEPVGALVHDPAVLDDPELATAIAATARVAVDSARLGADVRAQIAALSASRERLVDAARAERRRLAAELERGALAELDAVGAALEGVEGAEAARADLARARVDVLRLAEGLRPAALAGGLRAALEAGARALPIPAELELEELELAADVETALGFVSAEALANVAKHARAGRVAMRLVRVDGEVALEVADDGVGGADASGSGLRGVRRRVEALGGRVELRTDADGTRLRASIPVAEERER
jgi:signal transduction histidine kinase